MIQFQQTNVAAPCGAIRACGTAGSITSGSVGYKATVGGVAGVTVEHIAVDDESVVYFAHWQLTAGPWVNFAGAWQVRVRVSTPPSAGNWTHCYLCVVNAACAVVATLGGGAIDPVSLTQAGVKSVLGGITTADREILTGESVYIVCACTGGVGDLEIVSDQLIDTTLAATSTEPWDVRATQTFIPGGRHGQSAPMGGLVAGVYVPGLSSVGEVNQ